MVKTTAVVIADAKCLHVVSCVLRQTKKPEIPHAKFRGQVQPNPANLWKRLPGEAVEDIHELGQLLRLLRLAHRDAVRHAVLHVIFRHAEAWTRFSAASAAESCCKISTQRRGSWTIRRIPRICPSTRFLAASRSPAAAIHRAYFCILLPGCSGRPVPHELYDFQVFFRFDGKIATARKPWRDGTLRAGYHTACSPPPALGTPVRPTRGGGRRVVRGPGRRSIRPARSERRGQDHDAADAGRADSARRAASRFDGVRDRSRERRAARGAHRIPDRNARLWEQLTVADNMRVYARLFGIARPGGRRRASRCGSSSSGIAARDRAALASKGMKQKLALARALSTSPIVLLDEPTANLDPKTSRGVRDLLLDLRAATRASRLDTQPRRIRAGRGSRRPISTRLIADRRTRGAPAASCSAGGCGSAGGRTPDPPGRLIAARRGATMWRGRRPGCRWCSTIRTSARPAIIRGARRGGAAIREARSTNSRRSRTST